MNFLEERIVKDGIVKSGNVRIQNQPEKKDSNTKDGCTYMSDNLIHPYKNLLYSKSTNIQKKAVATKRLPNIKVFKKYYLRTNTQ